MTEPARGVDRGASSFWPAELDEHYECLGELGRGGMAVVFRARDRELGRHVAIKVVRPRFPADQEAVARLAREARTVAQLEHANIVALYAVRHLSDKSLALVMQLVPGRTLKAALEKDGPFEPARVEAVLRDVARALAYAHRAGVVHRDVKPENIFIDDVSGRAMLSDFGVARAMDAPSELTATGTTIGTPTYMSPEQIDGAPVDGRADLYSLGMVGWEMLTGERPWAGESLYSVIYRQKHDPLPPIFAVRNDVPPRLQYLLDGLVQKHPDRRWSSASRFLSLLSSDDALPGMEEWLSLQRRRMRSGIFDRTKQRASAAVGAALETMRFTRKDTPAPAGAPPSPESTQPFEPGQMAAGTPPVAPPHEPSYYFELLEPDPARAAAIARNPDEAQEPAVLTIPRQSTRARIYSALAAVGVVAVGLWIWMGLTPGGPETSTAGTAAPLADSRGVEIPVLPPESTFGPRDSLPALAESIRSDTPVIDTARAFLSRLAEEESLREPVTRSRPQRTDPPRPAAAPPPRQLEPARQPVVARTPASTTLPRAAAAGSTDSGDDRRAITVPPIAAAPPAIAFPAERRTISSGARHSCLIGSEGHAVCWGSNEAGQLGDGGFESRAVAAPVAGDFRFTQLAAGVRHTCGLTADGGIFCWGNNSAGQLGDATTSVRAAPVRVNSDESFVTVRAGQTHTCALARTGVVLCWGANQYGQLGSGSRSARTSPAAVPIPGPVAALAAGANHTCAITRQGEVLCWGRNEDGQLGDGSTSDRTTPTPVKLDVPVVSVAAGAGHSCAVSAQGTAFCWGRNNYGQLGTGNEGGLEVAPSAVTGGWAFSGIVAGSAHTCARGRDGSVWCWGRNANGQLGDGTTDDRSRPATVPGLSRIRSLDAGAGHTCAMQEGGETWCWGFNVDGQVGRADRENALAPVRVLHPSR
jgi:serine/threonine protein kinase/alpha-tubulin suppressor-like RCC1 family protein